jgi:hypothetical protein
MYHPRCDVPRVISPIVTYIWCDSCLVQGMRVFHQGKELLAFFSRLQIDIVGAGKVVILKP